MTPKDLRLKLDLTQDEMAQKLGCSKSTVSLIEAGKRTPSLRLFKEYASVSKGKVTLAAFTQQ